MKIILNCLISEHFTYWINILHLLNTNIKIINTLLIKSLVSSFYKVFSLLNWISFNLLEIIKIV